MKVIVTGATGFVGQWLVEELLKQGDEVTIIVRDSSRVPNRWTANVSIVEADISQYKKLSSEVFDTQSADLFFHLAWAGTSGQDRADSELQLMNVQASCDAVRLAALLQCKRFIYAGSIMEYEAMQMSSATDKKPGMGNIYSTAKLTADYMAKTVAANVGIEYVDIIISNIYGAGEHSARFLNTTLRKLMRHESIPLTSGAQLYDFIYVTDAVKEIVLAAKKGKDNHSYYIGSQEQIPLREFVLRMKAVSNSESELLFGSVPMTGAVLSYQEFNTNAIFDLGFQPEISFEDGVKLTMQWMQEEENEH